jgi:hypothetical protein
MPPSRDSFRRNRVAPIDTSILARWCASVGVWQLSGFRVENGRGRGLQSTVESRKRKTSEQAHCGAGRAAIVVRWL